MAIDIRASISCNLGDIIQANVSDSSIAEAGLIKTTGVCEVVGISTPAIGTGVTFTYTTAAGITRTVPRELYVLSSFANPYRRSTEIQLGCALTYRESLREVIQWDALDDPANGDFSEADQELITVPIHASSVMDYCLSQLGLTATQNPLTNQFSIAEFDYSAGYVQVLNDLLVSESYCGFINGGGALEVFSLDASGGTGPVIGIERIIDIGAVNAGSLPGEAVVVNYSTLKLKQPDPDAGADGALSGPLWETVATSNLREVPITYQNSAGVQQYEVYSVLDSEVSTTTYKDFIVKNLLPNTQPSVKIITGIEKQRKVSTRRTLKTDGSVSIEGSLASNTLAAGRSYRSSDVTLETLETFTYDEYGNETYYVARTMGSLAHLAGKLPVQDWAFVDALGISVVSPSRVTDREVERIERSTETVGNFQRVTTRRYGPWTDTIAGQQAMASGLKLVSAFNDLNDALGKLFQQLYLLNTEVTTRRTSEGEIAPAGADVTNAVWSDGGDPANGYRTESSVELELALGSATAQRRIEFSLPYAPDDVFIKTGSIYSSEPSDAPQKASLYGRVQNRILLANRNGMSLQCAADVLPPRPYQQFAVTASGVSGIYRTNALSWTMSGEGIIVSCDGLFWGGAGASSSGTPASSAFFPTSPTITTLPTAPAVVDTAPDEVIGTVATVGTNPQTTLDAAFPSAVAGDGVQDLATDEFWVYDGSTWENVGTNPGPTMTVTTTVPVWNETVQAEGRIRLFAEVVSLGYPLAVLTEVPAYGVKTRSTVTRIRKIVVPAAAIGVGAAAPRVAISATVKPPAAAVSVAAAVPSVSTGAAVKPPAADLGIAALAPVVVGGASVAVPAVDVAVAGQAPVSVGPVPVLLDVPAVDVTVAAVAPEVRTGASVVVPAVDVAVASSVPTGLGAYDASFSSVSLLLHMDGSNNSTTFTDSSSNVLTVTANGNAKISTTESKFGGASGAFDGSGDHLRIASPPSSVINWHSTNTTVEYWIRCASFPSAAGTGSASVVVGNMSSSGNDNYWSFGPIGNGTVRFYYYNGASVSLTTTSALSLDVWHHLAFVLSGTSMTIYIDGASSASSTVSGTPQTLAATGFGIGQYANVSFNGYIDELRITKAARYTANFTPTTVAFPDR